MGQYYKAVTISKEGKMNVYTLQSKKFRETMNFKEYNFLKLMEHSWIGNPFADFFSHLIYKKPMTVAWVGDYAKHGGSAHDRMALGFFESVYGDSDVDYDVDGNEGLDYENPNGEFDYTGKCLVNHTEKVYFQFPVYNREEWNIYPISLLTAIGNGQGSGDYHLNHPDAKRVGSWALHEISIEDDVPDGYKEVPAPSFKE